MTPKMNPRIVASVAIVLVLGFLTSCVSQPARKQGAVEKMYVFNCGWIEVADISLFTGQPADKNKTMELTDSCYLIQHKKGTLVWDTGLSDEIAKAPGKTVKSGPFSLTVNDPFIAQLRKVGYAPEGINFIAFSHMHGDHSGNGNAFTRSIVLLQQEEYDAAFGPDPGKFRFNPATYGKLKDNDFIKLKGDYDVFGDGSVVIKRMIGHTPGHQSLFVRLPKSGPVVLSGDLAHFTDNWLHKRVPVFNFNKDESLKSMTAMEKFLKQTGAKLLIQHDVAQNKTIPHAPKVFE